MDPIDALLDELVKDGSFPPKREKAVAAQIRRSRAFLEKDNEALRILAGWPKERKYKVDGLPGLIADAWADHLLGDDVVIQPASPSDQGAMELLLENAGDLGGEAHSAMRSAVGEGEVWYRVYSDAEVADGPIVEWHPRDVVIPYHVGKRLIAAAVVSVLEPKTKRSKVVYRHLEIHTDGAVEHVLFAGSKGRIGRTVDLNSHPDLAELADAFDGKDTNRWDHGLPMLVGRVTNGLYLDRRLGIGISEYRRIEDDLLDLNEAKTIGAENVRLTAKRRVVVSEGAITTPEAGTPGAAPLMDNGDGSLVPVGGTFDAGEDVLIAREEAGSLDGGAGIFKVLEYSFDALPLILYKRDLVEGALTRVGLTPQSVGVVGGETGIALSGTALRIRLIPETRAGRGKGRPLDAALTRIVTLLAQIDALPKDLGGFGRSWVDAAGEHSVERGDALPVDVVEEAQVESTLVSAGVRSVETSVRTQHPRWGDEEVAAEVARLKEERPATSGLAMFGGDGGLS